MSGYHVKFKGPAAKKWSFLGHGGIGTQLRVHALSFHLATAEDEARDDAKGNPGVAFKVVDWRRKDGQPDLS